MLSTIMNKKVVLSELEGMQKSAFHNKKLIQNNRINLHSTRLYFLYQEYYQLTIFGFANASIVMGGILLETLLKEILFSKGDYDYKSFMNFSGALNKCEKYLSKKDYHDLNYIKDNIRNPYQHHNLTQLTGGVHTKGVSISKTGVVSKFRTISSEELRPLEFIGKMIYDGKTFIRLFRYCHKISLKLSKKYLK